jgi:CelD/BcsL family acetyltransferase involved in cellulose biosynthesis
MARERGWLRICALLVAGRLAAFELDLDYDGKRFSLKAGYDENWSRQSPGKVLQLRVLEAAVAAGLSSYEFGGVVEPWKMEWTRTLRPRLNVLTFADRGASRLLGRALREAASRRGSARSTDNPATEE